MAACITNQLVPADYEWVKLQPFRSTNICLPTSYTQPVSRLAMPSGTSCRWKHDITELYLPGYFSVLEHGNAVKHLLPAGADEATARVWLEPHDIVWLVRTCIIWAQTDIKHYASPGNGGVRVKTPAPLHRLRSRHFTIPPECLRYPDVFFDSRKWDTSLDGPPEERAFISVLGPTTPSRRPHFTSPISTPGVLHAVQDSEVDGWSTDGLPQLTHTPRACMLCINHKSYFSNADAAIMQLRQDIALGIVEGPFQLPGITPFRIDPSIWR